MPFVYISGLAKYMISIYSDGVWNGTRDSSVDTKDSRIRAAAVVLMGSRFSLFLSLTTPDFTDPYYLWRRNGDSRGSLRDHYAHLYATEVGSLSV